MKSYTEKDSTHNIGVAIFENNQASNQSYKADLMVTCGNTDGLSIGWSVRNNFSNQAAIQGNRSMWASIGTVIKVYSAY